MSAGAATRVPEAFGGLDRGVIVLGVHRSGTSLLTAGLQAIGCDLGDMGDVPSNENPRGFFEHASFRRFNDRLLADLGASWDNWGFVAEGFALGGPGFAARRTAAIALLKSSFGGRALFALKEPRISFLAPFWEAVFHEAALPIARILIVRDPVEVAASQTRRARANRDFHRILREPEGMHALWCVITWGVLHAIRDDGTLVVAHRDLYERPRDLLHEIAGFLQLKADTAAIDRFASEFVDPALRGGTADDAGAAGGWSELSARMYRDILDSGLPRRLTVNEARAIAAAQTGFAALLPYLEAVRGSMAGSVRAAENDAKRLAAVRAALDAYGEIAVADGAARSLERIGSRRPRLDPADPLSDRLDLLEARRAHRIGDEDVLRPLLDDLRRRVAGLPGRRAMDAGLVRRLERLEAGFLAAPSAIPGKPEG
mgnify:CR=1 FL=1